MWPEALPAFGIIVGCITVTGLALRFIDKFEHSGKVSPTYGLLSGELYLERSFNIAAREIQIG